MFDTNIIVATQFLVYLIIFTQSLIMFGANVVCKRTVLIDENM